MINKLSHTCIYVLDHDSAYDFYVNKLGCTVVTDAPMGDDNRWLTLTLPAQNGLDEYYRTPLQMSLIFT